MLFETHIRQAPRGIQRLAARQRGDEAAIASAQALPELPPLYRERPNDFSARDTQMAQMQGRLGPSKGKSFDSGNAIGPWIVTRGELPDPYDLPMSARVNGETWTTNSSAGMLFSFEEVIAFISRDETLHAGEFIGSGTVGLSAEWRHR